MVTFTVPVTMRVPESRLMPSVMVVIRGTEGPAGMIRTHAASATCWPSQPHFHRHHARTQAFGQRHIDL